MKQLPSSYSAKETEAKLRETWNEKGVFKANPESEKPHFCVMMPPPNVTGVLHMGHAMDDTLQDILVRWHSMQGYDVLWVPGTDHAGIATQTVVEKHLIKTEGKRRCEYEREEFVSRIFDWKEKSQSRIIEQLKAVGCACDWSHLRFSMDEVCSKAVRTMFKKLFELDLIYRGDYLVNWDPVTGTALADDEVEYEEKQSFLWTIRYPIEGFDFSLSVATTRPETVLGDTAVAVNPTDERYKNLVGLFVRHPITKKRLPIIADDYVDPAFGTGVVKITPAHDPNDYQIGLRHNLPLINILTKEGRINAHGDCYQGMTTQEAREAILSELKNQGNLVKVEPHTHRVGVSYRSKAIIEPMLSKQWFVKVSSIKHILRSYVEKKEVSLFPSHWDGIYFQWIDNLRDWCISRQLWWGHRIPIWYRKDNSDIMICSDGEGDPEEVASHPDDWTRETDVLDTWFSSALWPFSTLGWPNQTKELKAYFPNSTLITGHDILFFWVARMIMMSHFAFGTVPFKKSFLHGLIYSKSYWRKKEGEGITYVTQEERKEYDLGKATPPDVMSRWEKMSKSKGNVLDPMEIIEEYGADAMRFALASSVTEARQIDLDRRKFEEFRNFSNKLWNGSRFILMYLSPEEGTSFCDCVKAFNPKDITLEDRWILSRLHKAQNTLKKYLTEYQFDKASYTAYSFFWDEFCSWWIECSKPALSGREGLEKEKNKKALASVLLLETLQLLHPFVPFVTEEIYSYLREGFLQSSLAEITDKQGFEFLRAGIKTILASSLLAETLLSSTCPLFEKEEAEFERMKNTVTQIRAIRGEMKLSPGTAIDLVFFSPENSTLLPLLKNNERLLRALLKVQTVTFDTLEGTRPLFGSSAPLEDLELMIPLPKELYEQEQKRIQKELIKLEFSVEKTKKQLEYPGFSDKAPPHVIENMTKGLVQQEKEIALLKEKQKLFQ
jgi:valyl-tRNA synthetase